MCSQYSIRDFPLLRLSFLYQFFLQFNSVRDICSDRKIPFKKTHFVNDWLTLEVHPVFAPALAEIQDFNIKWPSIFNEFFQFLHRSGIHLVSKKEVRRNFT